MAPDAMFYLDPGRVRSARNAAHLTQKQVAERTGYSQQWVSKAERGKGITPALASRISAALDRPISDLVSPGMLLDGTPVLAPGTLAPTADSPGTEDAGAAIPTGPEPLTPPRAEAPGTSLADDLATRLVALTELGKRVEQARGDAKAALARLLTVGDRKQPTYPGDPRTRLGSVTYAAGKVTATVTDPDLFAAWVVGREPDAVDLVLAVKPWYEAQILGASQKAGEPCAPDGTLDVPGITVTSGVPYITTVPDRKVADDLWRLILTGELGLSELTQEAAE